MYISLWQRPKSPRMRSKGLKGDGSSLPLYKAKIIMNVERDSHSETKRRESLSILGVYTAAFFSQEKLMLKLAKEQGAPSFWIVPFFVAARSNACETIFFEETYSLFPKILYYIIRNESPPVDIVFLCLVTGTHYIHTVNKETHIQCHLYSFFFVPWR